MTARRKRLTVEDYVQGVLANERTILARAITLIESNHPLHQEQAQDVLQQLLPHTGKSHRIGITGVPGVGKSTFIERLGQTVLNEGHKLAVLAVDPTSAVKGGSILGDKTRMQTLSRDERAFIRPSPTQGNLGGVHRKTRETMLLCEAAGYDIVLIETVGVGQSEIAVSRMVDTYLVLMLAGAGDELQGIKKGILEVADIIAINKADGDNALQAKRARQEYRRALQLVKRHQNDGWKTQVLTCSGLHGEGVQEVWDTLQQHLAACEASGTFDKQRQTQRLDWMWNLLREELMRQFKQDERVAALLPQMEADVISDALPPTKAAIQLLELFRSTTQS
jgi:LAO/AO transport system kinase